MKAHLYFHNGRAYRVRDGKTWVERVKKCRIRESARYSTPLGWYFIYDPRADREAIVREGRLIEGEERERYYLGLGLTKTGRKKPDRRGRLACGCFDDCFNERFISEGDHIAACMERQRVRELEAHLDSERHRLAREQGLRVYGDHYLRRSGWALQKRSPGYECGNCRSSSMTSACWCGWETIVSGADAIDEFLGVKVAA